MPPYGIAGWFWKQWIQETLSMRKEDVGRRARCLLTFSCETTSQTYWQVCKGKRLSAFVCYTQTCFATSQTWEFTSTSASPSGNWTLAGVQGAYSPFHAKQRSKLLARLQGKGVVRICVLYADLLCNKSNMRVHFNQCKSQWQVDVGRRARCILTFSCETTSKTHWQVCKRKRLSAFVGYAQTCFATSHTRVKWEFTSTSASRSGNWTLAGVQGAYSPSHAKQLPKLIGKFARESGCPHLWVIRRLAVPQVAHESSLQPVQVAVATGRWQACKVHTHLLMRNNFPNLLASLQGKAVVRICGICADLLCHKSHMRVHFNQCKSQWQLDVGRRARCIVTFSCETTSQTYWQVCKGKRLSAFVGYAQTWFVTSHTWEFTSTSASRSGNWTLAGVQGAYSPSHAKQLPKLIGKFARESGCPHLWVMRRLALPQVKRESLLQQFTSTNAIRSGKGRLAGDKVFRFTWGPCRIDSFARRCVVHQGDGLLSVRHMFWQDQLCLKYLKITRWTVFQSLANSLPVELLVVMR